MLKIAILALLTLPAFGQSKVIGWTTAEDAWGSQGNGGAEFTGFLIQTINQPQACVYGPLHITDGADILPGGSICVKGGHGSLHFADFGGGPFMIDDAGYVYYFPVKPMYPRAAIHTFANGVH